MTEHLHCRFKNIIRKIGFKNDIEHPVFYNANFGIRFELGNGEVYIEKKNCISPNPIYVSGCLERAKKLLTAVSPNILRVDVYPKEEYFNVTSDFLIETLGLPEECVKEKNAHHLYWSIIEPNKCIPILNEIILSDISGEYSLNSCVYFSNSSSNILYYPYDDRGADIVSDNRDILMPIYKKFNNWILEYDRKRIEEIYGTSN